MFLHCLYILQIEAMSPLSLLALLLLLSPHCAYPSTSCFTGCDSCEIFFIYVYCTHCVPPRNFNDYTGYCDCPAATFEQAGLCAACPNSCRTCQQNYCTACTEEKYLDATGKCYCINGQNIDENGQCEAGRSLGMILGIAFGCFAFLSCVVILLYMIRSRHLRHFETRVSGVAPVFLQELQPEQDSAVSLAHAKTPFHPQTCSICLESSPLFLTPCGHYFHQHCITSWLAKRPNCPNCNHPTQPAQLRRWCELCRKELLRPVRYRILSRSRGEGEVETLSFESVCHNCEQFEETIELQKTSSKESQGVRGTA